MTLSTNFSKDKLVQTALKPMSIEFLGRIIQKSSIQCSTGLIIGHFLFFTCPAAYENEVS